MKKLFNSPVLRLFIVAAAFLAGQPVIATAALFAPFMPMSNVLGLSSIDTSALTGYAQNMQRQLISTLVNSLDIVDDIQVQPNVKNSMALPKMKAGNGFKPYTGTFQNENSTTLYTDRILTVNAGQRDILVDPEDFRTKYIAWTTAPGSPAVNLQSQIPFAQYFYQQIIKEFAAEINDSTAFFGFDKTTATAYSGATVYNPGNYITFTQNGVLKYFLNLATTTAGQDPTSTPAKWQEVSARAVTPGIRSYLGAITGANLIATGAITDSTTGINKALQMYQALPGAYRKVPMVMHVSYTDYDYIVRGIYTTFYQYQQLDAPYGKAGTLLPLSGGNCIVKPATWLNGSRRILLEPADPATINDTVKGARGLNLIMGTDLLSDINQIKAFEQAYQIQLAIKVVFGFQIADVNALWINDQA